MNNYEASDVHLASIIEQRELNDGFRRTLHGGSLHLSAGILGLGSEAQSAVLEAVRTLDDFDDTDDPRDAHDIGDVEISASDHSGQPHRVLIFFRVAEMPDRNTSLGNESSQRMLTVMLADEW